MNKFPIALGVDLGGTKIEIIAIDNTGNELLRRRIPTPQGDYQGTLLAIAELIRIAETELNAKGTVGIGIPGAMSLKTGRVKNANSTCLIDQPLKQDLERLLKRKIRVANDANCFALSEAIDGAAVGAESVFGVIIGTGVGGGIVVNGKALNGVNAIAGEWGHNPLPLPQAHDMPLPSCYCGREGCIETYLSGPSMKRQHMEDVGEMLDPPEILRRADIGDRQCEITLQRYEERLARALSLVINIFDPNMIVLGGGMSNILRLYDNVPRLWDKYVFSDEVTTTLVRNVYGDSSGVRGAAWLWQ